MVGLIIFGMLFGIPVAEIALFILIGGEIGVWSTIAVVFATAIIGTFLVRAQGLSVLTDLNTKTSRGELPLQEIVSAAFIVVAGILLVTPGFLTDAIGFSFLIPAVRTAIGLAVTKLLARHGTVHHAAHFTMGGMANDGAGGNGRYDQGPGGPFATGQGGPTIDGDYEDLTDPKDAPETATKEASEEPSGMLPTSDTASSAGDGKQTN